MDWARDNAGLSDSDLKTVFKYAPRESTVIQILERNDYEATVSTLESDEEWEDWLDEKHPQPENFDSGLVILLARQVGEATTERVTKTSLYSWVECLNQKVPSPTKVRNTATFSALSEKKPAAVNDTGATAVSRGRGVRTLPFSQETFRLITKKFHTHGSIARVISRTDVPVFSSEQAVMEQPAYVSNCRSSNAWDGDLAMSSTYYPDADLTFAIVYGCSLSIEKEIVKRLTFVNRTSCHPLVVPGVLAELERSRHAKLVNNMIVTLESRILQLRFNPDDLDRPVGVDADSLNEAKRTAWLDTAYLRNGLVTWKAQLGKMVEHIQELEESVILQRRKESTVNQEIEYFGLLHPTKRIEEGAPIRHSATRETDQNQSFREFTSRQKQPAGNLEKECNQTEMLDLGRKIKGRILAIQDEYEDWVRDCTMRVDGMAIAAQWAQGETGVEIALSTRQDSKYMRSIAVLTLVFLPGTWLAGVFSMSFFNWQSDGGGANISVYVWIYVVVTFILTSFTVGCWYYVTVYRPRQRVKESLDEEWGSNCEN